MTPLQPRARRWHEYRPGGKGDPVTGPAGTYRVDPDRILAWVGPGTFTTTEQLQDLAARVHETRFCQVTLIGHHEETRRVQDALQQLWGTQQPPAPRKPRKAPAAPKPKCGQPTQSGEPCQLTAGWGCDVVGEGACLNHGGSAAGKLAAIEAVSTHLKTVVKHARTAQKRPLTERERLEGGIALAAVLIARASRKR